MRLILCGIAVLTLWAAVGPASATIFDVHYSGKVLSGTDQSGVFGSTNTDLGNLNFDAYFRFDSAFGDAFEIPGSVADLTTEQPDPSHNALLSASLTISNASTKFNGLDSSDFSEFSLTGVLLTGAFDQATQPGAFDASFVSFINTADNLPSSFSAPYKGSLQPGSFTSSFQVATDDQFANGILNATDVTISPESVSAAPEPGTWALMFAGVAMLSAMLRFGRRRECATLAA